MENLTPELEKLAETLYGDDKKMDMQEVLDRIRKDVKKRNNEEVSALLVEVMGATEDKEWATVLCDTILQEHGKSYKVAGARSYASIVKEMRNAQKRYFQLRDNDSLQQSKSLEAKVDKANKAILDYYGL